VASIAAAVIVGGLVIAWVLSVPVAYWLATALQAREAGT
jgi:hypothetical protein